MSSFTYDTLEWPAFIKVIPWVQHLKLQRTFYSVALLLLLKSSSWLESWPDLTWILRSYEIRFVPKETNRTSQMSNKNTSKMQSKNLSKSVKYWSFTLLIMHYLFLFLFPLLLSLHSDFCFSHLRSLTFCLPFWHKPLWWAGFFSRAPPLAN